MSATEVHLRKATPFIPAPEARRRYLHDAHADAWREITPQDLADIHREGGYCIWCGAEIPDPSVLAIGEPTQTWAHGWLLIDEYGEDEVEDGMGGYGMWSIVCRSHIDEELARAAADLRAWNGEGERPAPTYEQLGGLWGDRPVRIR